MAVTARALLGALLFLVVASYLALPCMTRDASQFQSVGAPNACSQHDVFKPVADISRLFKSLTAEAPYRLPVALLAAAVPFLLALVRLPVEQARRKRRRRARNASLPFATADPPKLPAFAALRDA